MYLMYTRSVTSGFISGLSKFFKKKTKRCHFRVSFRAHSSDFKLGKRSRIAKRVLRGRSILLRAMMG